MRVCGGELRGRPLRAPRGRATRPTSERARQGLFDWLGSGVAGARVLDLYAGSGALGIEALSRGAERAVFVERGRDALRELRRNLEDLGLAERGRVIGVPVARALAQLAREGARFDLLLADPPYGRKEAPALAQAGDLVDILAPGGVLVIERGGREPAGEPGPGLAQRESREYGETVFDRYEATQAVITEDA